MTTFFFSVLLFLVSSNDTEEFTFLYEHIFYSRFFFSCQRQAYYRLTVLSLLSPHILYPDWLFLPKNLNRKYGDTFVHRTYPPST